MASNIETMFYVRETPWHGLGTRVLTAPASKEALEVAGLNWKVVQEPVYEQSYLYSVSVIKKFPNCLKV